MEQTIKEFIIKRNTDTNEYFIDILQNGYNLIDKTIYNSDLAKQVLQLIEQNLDC